jgi:hypothetical protein
VRGVFFGEGNEVWDLLFFLCSDRRMVFSNIRCSDPPNLLLKSNTEVPKGNVLPNAGLFGLLRYAAVAGCNLTVSGSSNFV